jgi:hypothetical protein
MVSSLKWMRPASLLPGPGATLRRSAYVVDELLIQSRQVVGTVLDLVHEKLLEVAYGAPSPLDAPKDVYLCAPLDMSPARSEILERAKARSRALRDG